MFVGRACRLIIAAVLAVGSLAYVGLRAGGGGSPAGAAAPPTIVIPLNAMTRGYVTKSLTITRGTSVRVVNRDNRAHTVTSVKTDAHGNALFSVYVLAHQTVALAGVPKLAAGRYPFYCRLHPTMRGVLIVKGGGGGTTGSTQTFDTPLRIPPVLTGSRIAMTLQRAPVQVFARGNKTLMWTYNGTYPGPTIVRPAGQRTTVKFTDKLPGYLGTFSTHLHGDHHPSPSDGQPTTFQISPSTPRVYNYPLADNGQPVRAGFDYYHDHRMGGTGRNNWHGLQGFFIVTSPVERLLGLPSGGYDVPLMVSDRSFTATHQLTNPFPSPAMVTKGSAAPPGDATVGSKILVNGKYSPYFNVTTHRYRLRLLNASNFQSYDFALSDGRSFLQVGTGDALLPHPVTRSRILLGPAQRVDVVVNFAGELGKRILLKSIPRANAPKGFPGSPTASLMQFRVVRKVVDHSRVPFSLQAPPAITVPQAISKVWTIGLTSTSAGSYWTVDGKMFDPTRVDYTVKLNATQKWKIVNRTGITHYFHIHEEQWHTIKRDGRAPDPWERGLEDTWRLDPGESVVVAAKFTDYTGVFMLHCHMLDHEDHGLMAQFKVTP
jgi:FtsP/CotA-like multicopper oxidase with cupredoxin domain/plastocyanin